MATEFEKSSMGNKKSAVYEMQYYLKFIAKHTKGITEVTPDGIFGKKTEDAVREFQKKYSLDPTGEINRTTWNRITTVYFELKEEYGAAEPIYIYPVELSAMKKGDDYGEILILQGILKKFSRRYNNLGKIGTTGVFDDETEDFVRNLQGIFGLPQTGEVNKKTWNRIAKFYSVFAFND